MKFAEFQVVDIDADTYLKIFKTKIESYYHIYNNNTIIKNEYNDL